MRVGSLFSGYEGLGMAVDVVFPGAQRAWFCEWDEAPSKILDHHWPTVPNHRDVTQIDWDTMPPVDILTGGYPCQPFSAAGQRKGTDDDRHLWPYVRDAIRHLRPRYTLLENVAGHRSMGFDRVLGDLAEDGLDVRWTSLRASDVGAPHHRERLFILVTDPSGGRPEGVNGVTGRGTSCGSRHGEPCGGDRRTSADTDSGECDGDERAQGRGPLGREIVAGCGAGLPAHTDRERHEGGRATRRPDTEWASEAGQRRALSRGSGAVPSDDHSLGREQGAGQSSPGESEESGDLSSVAVLPDAENYGRQRTGEARHWGSGSADGHSRIQWGAYAPAVRRWERLTRPAPAPTELNSNGKPRLSAAFAEWMMGLPAGHVTDPAIGISRSHQLKAIGNGVCPQQAIAAYAALRGRAE
ncbi:DNA cytosine methyltransferase [Rhodococcus sp. IEGM 27]|nr:DNA cytosine methyltransferase [Rhodococcus sp. IEGM 27]MDV8028894.1 DNA cytosine methyltransferase [Rhodococcus sp. IEGM 27]